MSVSTLNEEIRQTCNIEGDYPNGWLRHETCPCCGADGLSELFSRLGFSHAQCSSCHFVCLNPYPPPHIIKKLYEGPYYTASREIFEYRMIKNGQGVTPYTAPIELIDEMIVRASHAAAGDWLDVGGGLGTIAAFVKKRKPGWRVLLNEFNSRSLELARELFALQAVSDDADQLARNGQSFDVISVVSVLEHIADPVGFIGSYVRLLKPGGTMALLVPQFTRLNATVSFGTTPIVAPPFHLSLFNETNLRRAVTRGGLSPEMDVLQAGPAAFSLLHHYAYEDYWDTTIPTDAEPAPKAFMLKPYPIEMAVGLNALGEADKAVSEHFARTDGRQYIAVFARK